MSDLSTNNPIIVEFFKMNNLFTLETFLLHYINVYTTKTGTIEISADELIQIFEAQQNINNCKRNLDNMLKEMKTICYHIKNSPLDEVFSKHLNIKQTTFICDKCQFSCSTKRGLVTHQRKCNTVVAASEENTAV